MTWLVLGLTILIILVVVADWYWFDRPSKIVMVNQHPKPKCDICGSREHLRQNLSNPDLFLCQVCFSRLFFMAGGNLTP